MGISTRFANLEDEVSIEALIDENTRLIFFETVTNPQLEIHNIDLLKKIATKHQLVLMADSTLTFDLESEAACFKFMNRLKIIRRATNLNDNKSLIIHPWSTIYVEFPPDERQSMGIRPCMMRLSVGIEGINDLIDDIEQALN